ncbi:MAG: hypothetical protein WC712_02840 [Candidatus Brocadiia bacterium]
MPQENLDPAKVKVPGWPIADGPRVHLDRAIKRLQRGRRDWIVSFGFLGGMFSLVPFARGTELVSTSSYLVIMLLCFAIAAVLGMFIGHNLSKWMLAAQDYLEYCLAVEDERMARKTGKIGTFCSMCHKECDPRDGCVVGDKFLCNECMIKEGDALPKKKSRTPTS